MKIVAIIPARGHSKGILRKNLQLICGKPLLAYAIEAARSARHIDRVVVTTDDPEIKSISVQDEAEVIDRPTDISSDESSSESAIIHALHELEIKQRYVPDITAFLQCTSPLTQADDIDKCIELLIDRKADTALTVTDFHYFIWRQDQSGDAVGINHDKSVRKLRQQRKNQCLETGAVYVMRTEGFKLHRHRFFGRTVMHEVPIERCLEIDEAVDLKYAELLIREQQAMAAVDLLPKKIEALIFDFDGVFTDNRVIVHQSGHEAVLCDRGDGMGIAHLNKLGIPMVVLSTEDNPVVKARCQKLKLKCIQGVDDKLKALRKLLREHRYRQENVIFLGNDVNDKECLNEVGCGVVVKDAHPDVKSTARIILSKPGGKGAIRKLADLIEIKMRGKDQ